MYILLRMSPTDELATKRIFGVITFLITDYLYSCRFNNFPSSYWFILYHRPFNYSRKESESNDVIMQFEEFSNMHNSDGASNATRSNLVYKIV